MGIRPTFFGLEIARTGLTVSQRGLDVTGHNISNVDTPGFTRQRLINTAYEPYAAVTQFRPVDMALVGSGAKVIILDQVRSAFLDRQFRTEQSLSSYWETRTQGLTYVESLLEDESNGSLTAGLNQFLTALNTIHTEASDREQRVAVKQAAISLTQSFNTIYERLVDLQKNQNTSVEAVVLEINTIAQNISVLNKSIYVYELEGQPANDLRDKRNLLLDQLSALIDVDYETTADNQLIVRLGGEELIRHVTVNELECRSEPNAIAGEADISVPYWATGSAAGTALSVSNGELRAHMDLRDGIGSDSQGIPYYMNQLNVLVRAIAEQINAVHTQGFTHPSDTYLSDPSDPSSPLISGSVAGGNFFEVPAGGLADITAGNFKLDDAILDEVNGIYKIAASDKRIVMDQNDPDYNDPAADVTHVANQNNIRKLIALFDRTDLAHVGNFESFMGGVIQDIALTLSHSKNVTSAKNTLLLSVDNQRTSVSGVSLDEEMTNLIKYQHAYAGASRVITTMDEALETLINKMGLVGR